MRSSGRKNTAAFTLVEVLVAAAILVAMVGFLLTVMDQTARIWSSTSAKVEQFREARNAFERVSSRLAQATLNTYWDYDNATAPTRYERRSELRFIADNAATLLGTSGTTRRMTHAVFFNAPMGLAATDGNRGLSNALNALGFFVEFGDDTSQRPSFITPDMIGPRWRFRLMEFSQPTEKFSLYQFTNGNPGVKTTAWFTGDVNSTASSGMKRVVGENVIAFILTPRLAKAEETPLQTNATHSPLAPAYSYDSTNTSSKPQLNPRNQLPPVMQLTMVAIDEKSAERLDLDSAKSDVFGIVSSNLFKNTANFTADLATLETTLAQTKVRYRIFTTNVHIRAAKWSREQAN